MSDAPLPITVAVEVTQGDFLRFSNVITFRGPRPEWPAAGFLQKIADMLTEEEADG